MTVVRSLPIRYRLIGFVALALGIIFSMGAYSVVKLNQLSSNGMEMKRSSEKVVNGLTSVRAIGELRRLTSEFLTTGDKVALKKVNEAAGRLAAMVPDDLKGYLVAYLEDMKTLSVRMDSYRNNKMEVTRAERGIAKGIKDAMMACNGTYGCLVAVSKAVEGFGEYLDIRQALLGGTGLSSAQTVTDIVDDVALAISKARKGQPPGVATVLSAIENAFYDLDDAMGTIVAIEKKVRTKRGDVLKKLQMLDTGVMRLSMDAGKQAASLATLGEAISRRAFSITSAIGGVCLVIFSLFGYVFSRSIIVPLEDMRRILEVMAGGDLRNRLKVRGNDELTQVARSFNSFLESITALVGSVKGVSDSVGQEAKALDELSDQMVGEANAAVEASREASTDIEQIAEYMHQTSTMVDNLAQATNEIASNTANTASLSENLSSKIQGTRDIIQELSEHAKSIGDVIGLIGSIAEQTNLLALNATIEAARAGEAGKGFAVVANEVKELAKQTADATERIAPIISSIQKSVEESVASINESVSAMDVLRDSATTVAAAVEEQTATYSEINEQVRVINDNIQSVKEGVNLLADSANENLKESEILKQRASILKSKSDDLNLQISGLLI